MNKKYFFTFGFILIIVSFFIIKAVLSPSPQIIGDSVIYNTSEFFINITPNEMKGDGFVYFDILSKNYSGSSDFYLGFNKDKMNLAQIQIYNPHFENVTKSYYCGGEKDFFNFTTVPEKKFWCYYNQTTSFFVNQSNNQTIINGSELRLVFSSPFENGSLITKTAYWQETIFNEWSDLNLNFNKVDYSYQDTNKWIYTNGININSNILYRTRIYFDSKINPYSSEKLKYWFCFKPSSWTIQQMLDNNYCIDPVFSPSLNENLFAYYNFSCSTGSTEVLEPLGGYNLTSFSATCDATAKSGLGTAGNLLDVQADFWNMSKTDSGFDKFKLTGNFTINLWLDANSQTESGNILRVGTSSANTSHGWIIEYSGDTIKFINESNFAGNSTVFSTTFPNSAGWRMFTFVKNGSHFTMYQNYTSEIVTTNIATTGWKIRHTSSEGMLVGTEDNAGLRNWNGAYDEIAFWDRALTTDEINTLWNNSGGITRDDYFQINITLTNPANNSWVSDDASFNNSVSSVNTLSNVSLWHNNTGTWHRNKTLNYNTNSVTTNFTLNLSELTTIWDLESCDSRNKCVFNGSNYTLNIDRTFPSLNITSPTEGSTETTATPLITFTKNDTNLDSVFYNVSLQSSPSTTSISLTQISNGLNSTTLATLGNDDYSLNIIVNDSANNQNYSQRNFTVLVAGGGSSGGSGGGTSAGLTQAVNFSITTTNLKDVLDFSLPKESARPRKLNFLLINEGIKELDINVECSVEGVNKSSRGIQICDYVKFNKTSFKVSPNKLNPTIGTFQVESPPDSEYGDVYFFTIIAKTNEKTFDKLSVNANANTQAIFYKWSEIKGFIFPLTGISFAFSSILALSIFFIFVKIKRPIMGILLAMPWGILLFVLTIIFFPTEL